jgi:transcriptional regulator with XRE-family HTH domain
MSFKPNDRRVLPTLSTTLAIAETLQRTLADDGRSDKQLARAVDVVPRAVSAWRQGESLPSLPNFIALARQIPELRAAALRWLEADAGDPDTDRLTLELLRGVARELERRQSRLREEGAPA